MSKSFTKEVYVNENFELSPDSIKGEWCELNQTLSSCGWLGEFPFYPVSIVGGKKIRITVEEID